MSTTTGNQNIDRTVSTLKDGMTTATAGLEQAQASVREGMQKAATSAEEMFAFNQGNFEAVAKSGQIFAAGLQEMSQSVAAAARASMEETISTFKALTGVKSVHEALELQSQFLRSSMEAMATQTSRLADHSMKLSEQAFAPISARVSLATERFGRGQ